MKLHLPKLLALALLSAMGVSYADEPTYHAPNEIVTDSLPSTSPGSTSGGYVIAKDGTDTVTIGATKSVTGSLYVREGAVQVGSTTSPVTLALSPGVGNTTVGALSVAGKDAYVKLDNATLSTSDDGCIYVGGLDGNGKLEVTNGSFINYTYDSEKNAYVPSGGSNTFTIGVSEISGGLDASPRGSYKTVGSTDKYNEGEPGRGEVVVSGGSKMLTAFHTTYMGEGTLTVDGEGSLVHMGYKSGSLAYYDGFRALMGVGEGTTSEIDVKNGGEVQVYAGREFATNWSDGSTSSITVSGKESTFAYDGEVPSSSQYGDACFGLNPYGSIENAKASISILDGGLMSVSAYDVEFLSAESVGKNCSVEVKVSGKDEDGKDSELVVDSHNQAINIYEGTTIQNDGVLSLNKTSKKGINVLGATIANEKGGTLYTGGSFSFSFNYKTKTRSSFRNDGELVADGSVSVNSGDVVNTGSWTSTSLSGSSSGTITNSKTGTMNVGYSQLSGETRVVNEGVITVADNNYMKIRENAVVTNKKTIDGMVWIDDGGSMTLTEEGTVTDNIYVGVGNLIVDGDIKVQGQVRGQGSPDARIVFTEGSSLDAGGNVVKVTGQNNEVTLVMLVDGTVGQLTRLEAQEFFKNYNTDDSDLNDNLDIIVVGSDGSVSVRKLGDINDGIVAAPSGNQRAVYNALMSMVLDGVASPELQALVQARDPEALEAALDALSGHEYATAMSSQIEGNLGHLRRLKGAMGKGDMLGMATDAKSGASTTVDRWRAGVSVFHEETELDSDARGDGYDRSETGAMLNAEYFVKDDLTLGGAISYGRTNLRTDGAMRRHEDNTRFDVYALYGKKRWSFATSLGLGLHDHELKRALGRTDVDGYSINFLQDAAYTLLIREKDNVQVFGTVESSWNEIDSFSDGMVSGSSQDAWATDVTVGLRYNRALRAIGHAPAGVFTVQAGVTASIGDVKSGVDMSIGGYGYRQESATRNRWGWNLGAGVDVPVRSNMSVYGAVDAVIRGDSSSVDGQIGVKVSF